MRALLTSSIWECPGRAKPSLAGVLGVPPKDKLRVEGGKKACALDDGNEANGELNMCPVILESPDPIGTTKNLSPRPLASMGRPRFLTPLHCVRNDTHQSRLTTETFRPLCMAS